jgi:hypothetical protein
MLLSITLHDKRIKHVTISPDTYAITNKFYIFGRQHYTVTQGKTTQVDLALLRECIGAWSYERSDMG